MELKGSGTEKHLRETLARELETQARYEAFAAAARQAGFVHAADIFFAIARNEAEHARRALHLLGGSSGVLENLKSAIENEHIDAYDHYPQAEKTAHAEGFEEAVQFFRKARDDERRHERQFLQALQHLENKEPEQGRTVYHSALSMAHFMLPHHANPAGFVHGGELMKFMDNAATVVAVRHCHAPVVTAMVDELRFVHPVRVGNVVFIDARITFVSRSSMEVRVEVEAEDLTLEERQTAVTAYVVMAAVDEAGRPAKVPPLILGSERDQQLFNEAGLRYRARKARSLAFED